MDFTLRKYKQLLVALKDSGYEFQTLEEYLQNPKQKGVVLRHDIDRRAESSLIIAKIEYESGITSSFYFREKKKQNEEEIIREIADLGHEIGYHYEDLSLFKGDKEKAIAHFEEQLTYFRRLYPVKTICMHGSPTSKFDNRTIWEDYNYKDFGIIGEAYLDVDFNKVFYLTDTGRSWDGDKYSVRDKVESSFTQKFHTTDEIIKALKSDSLPAQLMITTHPQRWTDKTIEWGVELLTQTIKNRIKLFLK
jgi:hypothetical protein